MTDVDKKLQKRWGKKFIDKRDWPAYNERLVEQGEYLLALDFVENWNTELAVMNCDKVGAPFRFPKTLIELQAVWHAKRVPYRMIEGMTRDLAGMGQLPEYNNYTTVNRRINDLDFTLSMPQGKDIVIFSDGTGLQAVNGGEYLREKYGKKNRRWVQIVMLGDAEHHEPISYEVHLIQESEPESTQRQLERLLKQGVSIAALGGDGGMDKKTLWQFLEDKRIKPVIKPDENARTDTDCELRNIAVRERNDLGYKAWARKHRYGRRWPATEGINGAIKRVFGEQLAATSETGMLQEASLKIWAYQRLKRCGEA